MRGKIAVLLKKQLYVAVFIGALCGGVMTWLYNNGRLEALEYASYDWRFYLRNIWVETKHPKEIVVVTWDDDTFKNMKTRYQDWPRNFHAKVISNLKKWGAKTIGVDIIFQDPGQNKEYDKMLADAIRQEGGNVILDSYFSATETEGGTGESFNLPHDLFLNAGADFGFVNVRKDEDTFLRRALLVSKYPSEDGQIFMSFAAEVARDYLGVKGGARASLLRLMDEKVPESSDEIKYVVNPGKFLYSEFGTKQPVFKEIHLGNKHVVPLDEANSILINYRGGEKAAVESVPYYQVYDGTADPKKFKDKIALVGIDTVSVPDIYNTPFSRFDRTGVAGVKCLANVIYTILHNDYLMPLSKNVMMAVIFILAVVSALLNIRFGFLVAPLISLFGAALYFVVSSYLFISHNMVTAIVTPDLAIILSSVGIMLYRGLTEQREKKRIHGLFSRYVTPAVAKELTENPDAVKMGGDMKKCSILFSDIRGFTNMSEKMTAPEVVEMLNDYLTEMTGVVFKHDGTLDKYIGDAVMAYWGAPLAHDDDPKRAVNTGLEMMVELKKLNERWAAEGKNRVVNIGVGVNTGDVVVGNMGSPQRTDFTVIGDHVNMASRLEGLTKEYGTPVLVTEPTCEAIKDSIPCRPVDIVRVKGKLQGIKIFEPFNMNEGDREKLGKILELSEKGFQHYLKKEWKEGVEAYKQVLELKPHDKLSEMFIGRCEAYMQEAPSGDWDGIFTYTKK